MNPKEISSCYPNLFPFRTPPFHPPLRSLHLCYEDAPGARQNYNTGTCIQGLQLVSDLADELSVFSRCRFVIPTFLRFWNISVASFVDCSRIPSYHIAIDSLFGAYMARTRRDSEHPYFAVLLIDPDRLVRFTFTTTTSPPPPLPPKPSAPSTSVAELTHP